MPAEEQGLPRSLLRYFITANVRVSRAFDRLLPGALRVDGNLTFATSYVPRALVAGDTVYDLGGGSRPFVDLATKQRWQLTVVGVDVSAEELAAAPDGIYDRTIAADLCVFTGAGDADSVICQATLEHVPDGNGAMRAIASSLKPGGRAYIFAPSRNALFARLNLLLPEAFKRRFLFAAFPNKAKGHDGFPAFYDRCTPREFERNAVSHGLVVEERRLFWMSAYLTVFAPAFVAWRIAQGFAYLLLGDNAAETFIYVLRKPAA